MAFLDEKIAKLQKETQILKRNSHSKAEKNEEQGENIKELTQEEVTEAIKNGLVVQNKKQLYFENKMFFEGKMSMLLPKDFFDEKSENDMKYIWSKKHVFSISLDKVNQKDEVNSVEEYTERIKSFFKQNKIYIEILESKEEKYKKFTKYITTMRVPTALDYIYQYVVYFKFETEIINLVFNCVDKNKKLWEKIMIGISELIEIHEGE